MWQKSVPGELFKYSTRKSSCFLIEKVSKMCTPCQIMDAQELSWPVESRTISLTTFAKDRWQTRNISKLTTGKPQQFETIRYILNCIFFSVEDIF